MTGPFPVRGALARVAAVNKSPPAFTLLVMTLMLPGGRGPDEGQSIPDATRSERAAAIRRLLALAEPGAELCQAEQDVRALGVNPFELLCAVAEDDGAA